MNNQEYNRFVAVRSHLDAMTHLIKEMEGQLDEHKKYRVSVSNVSDNLTFLKDKLDEALLDLGEMEAPEITDTTAADEAIRKVSEGTGFNPGAEPPKEVKLDPELVQHIASNTPPFSGNAKSSFPDKIELVGEVRDEETDEKKTIHIVLTPVTNQDSADKSESAQAELPPPPEEVIVDPAIVLNRNPDLNRGNVEITIISIKGSVDRGQHLEGDVKDEEVKPRTDGLTQDFIDRFGDNMFSLDKAAGTGLN